MKRHSWASPFILAAALAAAFVVTNGHAASDVRQPRLTKVASAVLGAPVSVTSHAFGCAGKVRACTNMTAGEAVVFEDGSRLIQLAPDIVARLKSTRIAAPEYPAASTGEAVFVFAHEIGHLKLPGGGSEAQADCYAARTWRGLALRLGFSRSQLPTLARQVHGSCWRP